MIVFVVTWYVDDDPPKVRVFDLEENAIEFASKIMKYNKTVRVTRCRVRSAAWD